MRGLWNLRALWMVVAATCVVSPCFGQSSSASEEANRTKDEGDFSSSWFDR
jgi:hypothetical protein